MHKTTWFYFIGWLLLITLNLNITTVWTYSKGKTCSAEKTVAANGHFEWKIHHKDVPYVVSEPDVCWQNDSIVVRQCDLNKGLWLSAIESCEVWHKPNRKCPEDLIEELQNGEVFCLKISEKPGAFDESFCYGFTKPLNPFRRDIRQILFKRGIDRLWLPVRRSKEKRYNPFVVRLPGDQWNNLYKLSFQDILSENHCLAAYIEENEKEQVRIEVTDCNATLHSVCAYDDKPVALNGCPQNFGALSYRPNECYGVTWEGQDYPKDYRMLNITEYYRNYRALELIFDEHKIKIDSDVEIGGTTTITNSKWALNIKKDKISLVPLGLSMKRLSVEHVPNRKNVKMVMRMDSDLEALVLTVYNKFYIWTVTDKTDHAIHCFTHAGYSDISKVKFNQIWENDSQTKTMFTLKMKSDDLSQYWCEAHTIFNFALVSTEKIVAAKNKKGHVFTMQFDNDLTAKFERTTLAKIAKTEAKEIKMKLRVQLALDHNLSRLVIHNVRIVDILSVSTKTSSIRYCIHTTASLKSSAVDNSFEVNSEEDDSVENEKGIRHDTEVRMRIKELLTLLMQQLQQNIDGKVRSIDFCLPEHQWTQATVGQSATVSTFCLQQNGLPRTRKCLGSFVEGAYWETLLNSSPNCITNIKEQLITKDLFEIDVTKLHKKDPEKTVVNIRKLLESNINVLIPADLYYLARIIRSTIKNIFKTSTSNMTQLDAAAPEYVQTLHHDTFIEIVRIYNYLLNVNETVMRSSIVLNSTNILLDAFESLIDKISIGTYEYDISVDPLGTRNYTHQSSILAGIKVEESDKVVDVIDYIDVGVVVKVASNFVIFVLDPTVANVTGVALFKADVDSGEEVDDEAMLCGAFKHVYYRFILANQSVNALLNEYNIVMGTFVPSSLWQRLDEISNFSNRTAYRLRPDPKVVIKVYSNDNLFQEDYNEKIRSVGRKVISVSIPGHDKDLPDILPLILTASSSGESDHGQYCSYWNYKSWANDGLILLDRSELNNNTILCGCTHLTPFAYLIGGSLNLSVDSDVEVIVTRLHQDALDLITFLGCSLSLFGIVGIFVTAFIFRSWRQKANSKVLLQLSTAIGLQMVLFCFVNTEEYTNHLIANEIFNTCIAIGASLHYSVLVQFSWMVIIAYLQFKRYVQVFGNTRPKRFFIKSTCAGWGLPIIPVALVLIFDSSSYIPHNNDSANPICYPSGMSLYISIVLPVTFVILANLMIFLVVIYNLVKSPAGTIRRSEKSLALSQIRLLVLLFFLLGFTWIFGLLTAMKSGILFSYIFCLTATLQGFVIFIYFILMDPVTRRMWCGKLRKLFGMKDITDTSLSSMKETTQSI